MRGLASTCRAVGPWWAALGITFNIVGGNFLVCVALFIAAADMVVRCLDQNFPQTWAAWPCTLKGYVCLCVE